LQKFCCQLKTVQALRLELLSNGLNGRRTSILEGEIVVTTPNFQIKEMSHSHGIPLHADRQVYFVSETGIFQTATWSSVHSRSWHHPRRTNIRNQANHRFVSCAQIYRWISLRSSDTIMCDGTLRPGIGTSRNFSALTNTSCFRLPAFSDFGRSSF
jgi:hypothetical protein